MHNLDAEFRTVEVKYRLAETCAVCTLAACNLESFLVKLQYF